MTQNANTTPNTGDGKKEEYVPLSVVQSLIDQIEDLKQGQTDLKQDITNKTDKKDEEAPKKVVENTMKLTEYQGNLVVGFNEKRGTWKKWDKERREDRIMMEVTVQNTKGDKESKKEVDYEFLMEDGLEIICPVLKMERELVEKKGKMIFSKEVVDYKTVATKNKVQQIVRTTKTDVTLEVPAPYNREITLNIDYVNIK